MVSLLQKVGPGLEINLEDSNSIPYQRSEVGRGFASLNFK